MADKTNQETNISLADKIEKDLHGMHIDVAEGNPLTKSEEKPTSSASPESLVEKRVHEILPDEDDSLKSKKVKLDQLQKQSSMDECNSTHKAPIAIDDEIKTDTPPLRKVSKYRGLPVYCQFRPEDDELSNLFLKKKALGQPLETCRIQEESQDIFSKPPRDFPDYPEETHWYFFCRKPNGQDPQNLWTQIGEDSIVFDRQENCVGIKRSFTLTEQEEEESNDIYLSDEEEPPREEWFMDEISLLSTVAVTDWVVCHVFLNLKVKNQESVDSGEESFDSDEASDDSDEASDDSDEET